MLKNLTVKNGKVLLILFAIELVSGLAWLFWRIGRFSTLTFLSLLLVIATWMVVTPAPKVVTALRQRWRAEVWLGLRLALTVIFTLFLVLGEVFSPDQPVWLSVVILFKPAVVVSLVMLLSRVTYDGIVTKRRDVKQWALVISGLVALLMTVQPAREAISAAIYPVSHFILAWQFGAVLILGTGLSVVVHRGAKNKWMDAAVFLGIWLAAALTWHFTPIGAVSAANINADPNFHYFPLSDEIKYDRLATNIALGLGRFDDLGTWANLTYVLGLGKVIVGLDSEPLMRFMMALFGVIPALLYLLGRETCSRTVGVFGAALYISAMANMIGSEDSAVSMGSLQTEPLMTLGMILLTLMLIKLWRQPRDTKLLYLYGGIIGFFSMVRVNILPFTIIPLFFSIQVSRAGLRRAARSLVLILLGLTLMVAPISIRNVRAGLEPVYFVGKLNDLGRRLTGDWGTRVIDTKTTRGINRGDWDRETDKDVKYVFDLETTLGKLIPIGSYDLNLLPRLSNDGELRANSNLKDHPTLKVLGFDVTDFNTYSFLLNLGLVLGGVVLVIRKRTYAAALPAMVYVLYFGTAIFSSTLIPRHVFPINWVPMYYYAICLVALIHPGSSVKKVEGRSDERDRKRDVHIIARVGLMLLLLASVFPIMEAALPRSSYAVIQVDEQTGDLPRIPADVEATLIEAGYDPMEVSAFLENEPQAALLDGVVMYPARGIDVEDSGLAIDDLILFKFVGEWTHQYIRVATGAEVELISGDRAVILTCPDPLREKREVALVLIKTDGSGLIPDGGAVLPVSCPVK